MLQANLIREALAGYARANEVIENERIGEARAHDVGTGPRHL
jgi:hypothetical protein